MRVRTVELLWGAVCNGLMWDRDQERRTLADARQRVVPARPSSQLAMLALQRNAGNRAVSHLVTSLGTQPTLQRDSFGDYITQAALAIWRGGPSLALAALQHKAAASENSVQYVGHGYHLGPGDALRHCGWAALVMSSAIAYELQDRAEALGQVRNTESVIRSARVKASGVLMAHEDIGDRKAADSVMDQHNNESGMELAAEGFRAGGASGLNEQALLAAARGALDAGRLKMFHPITGELISTGGWRAFRASATAPDPWATAAAPRPPAPAGAQP